MKPRILHCVYSGLGGHGAVLFTLLNERMRDAYDHFVLFFGVEELREEYAEECLRLGVPFTAIRKTGRMSVSAYKQVLAEINRFRPDVVFVNGTPLAVPILIARLMYRARWGVVVRETQANHLKTRLEWIGSHFAARLADAVVFLTEEHKGEVERRTGRLPRERAQVIPNGINTEEFTVRQRPPSDDVTIGMVSRLVPIKDHLTLIEAIRVLVVERAHTGLKLFIAGEGPTRQALEDRVAQARLQNHVSFPGLLSKDGIVELLGKADLYVHCTFGETMSNSILQAMACGLPIVASDVRGVSNMIRRGEDGLLVPAGQVGPLADALESLIKSVEARRKLGDNARARAVAEFSRQRMVEEYRDLWAGVARSRERPSAPVRPSTESEPPERFEGTKR